MPRPECVIFVGLQASGKSTFYRERFATTHVHVSRDLFPNARRPGERQQLLIASALEAGRSVVVDNTNPRPGDRAPAVALARERGARVVAYFFDASTRECVARNEKREGRAKVPKVAIFATARRMVRPSRAEGFDDLFTVRLVEGRFEVGRGVDAGPK